MCEATRGWRNDRQVGRVQTRLKGGIQVAASRSDAAQEKGNSSCSKPRAWSLGPQRSEDTRLDAGSAGWQLG